MIKKRANTTAFNVRMDIRDFASLVSAYRGIVPPSTSMSTYLRYAAEDFAKVLREKGKAQTFESTESANDYITDAGLRQQAKAVRAANALVLELAAEKASDLIADRQRTQPLATPTPEDIISILERNAGGGTSEGTT